MRPYAERRAARIDRLHARAANKQNEAAAAFQRADNIAKVIPLGQPILVGHHSEKRHRRDIARIDNGMRRGVEASKEAKDLTRRAVAAEHNTAISSDDPEALDKLRTKLSKLETDRAWYKEINTTIRTAKVHARKANTPWEPIAIGGLIDMGLKEGHAKDLVQPDFAGRIGIPDYQLTNLGSEIRRVEKRISELETRRARTTAEPETYGAIRIEESDNRVRVYFTGKPTAAIRDLLKGSGFRFSPTEGSWQRMTSVAAWVRAREIVQVANQT